MDILSIEIDKKGSNKDVIVILKNKDGKLKKSFKITDPCLEKMLIERRDEINKLLEDLVKKNEKYHWYNNASMNIATIFLFLFITGLIFLFYPFSKVIFLISLIPAIFSISLFDNKLKNYNKSVKREENLTSEKNLIEDFLKKISSSKTIAKVQEVGNRIAKDNIFLRVKNGFVNIADSIFEYIDYQLYLVRSEKEQKACKLELEELYKKNREGFQYIEISDFLLKERMREKELEREKRRRKYTVQSDDINSNQENKIDLLETSISDDIEGKGDKSGGKR